MKQKADGYYWSVQELHERKEILQELGVPYHSATISDLFGQDNIIRSEN